MEPQSKYVPANGINHHYLDWGNPSAHPLVMLHATGLCAQAWAPIARELAKFYHVMAFDQRGHGDSDPSDRGYSFSLVGDDLAAVIRTLELDSPYLVGHSSGGLGTLIAASLNPGLIGKSVLVETRVASRGASPSGGTLQQRAERTRMKRSIWDSRQDMSQAYRTRTAFKDWTDETFNAYIEGGTRLLPDGRAELKCLPDVEATFYESRDDLDVAQFFAELKGDFRLICGAYPGGQTQDDPGVTKFLQSVPGASFKSMGTGSHFLPLEFPDLVLKEILDFFGSP